MKDTSPHYVAGRRDILRGAALLAAAPLLAGGLPDMAAGPGLALGVDVLQINHQQQIMVGHGGLLLCFAPHQTAFSDSVYRTAPGIDKV